MELTEEALTEEEMPDDRLCTLLAVLDQQRAWCRTELATVDAMLKMAEAPLKELRRHLRRTRHQVRFDFDFREARIRDARAELARDARAELAP